jgi:hypothetical protein
MKSGKPHWIALACGAVLCIGGVSQSKTALPAAERTFDDAFRRACPATPAGATPIAGVKTAWAIKEASGGVRLLFSDQVLACRNPDWIHDLSIGPECMASWKFAFTLPPDLQKPGVYDLHGYEADYAESVVTSLPPQGCSSEPSCGGTASGSAGGGKGPESTIEIYDVTDECMTGRIQRLDRGVSNSEVDFTGTFQAVLCTPEIP